MDNCRIKWTAGREGWDLTLLIDGVEAGRVRQGAPQEMPGWYWRTTATVLDDGARVEGGCVADAPAESQEEAQEGLLACIDDLVTEQVQGNGR